MLAPHLGPSAISASVAPSGETSPSVLEALLARGSVARWRRVVPEAVTDLLARWAPQARTVVTPIDASRFDAAAVLASLPGSPAKRWLEEDLRRLVALLARVAGTSALRLTFGPVRDAQCPKLHVDYNRMRLLVTYVGPGTEWLDDADVNREALDHPPDCPCDANRAIQRLGSSLQQADAGDVLLLKGVYFAGLAQGAVHRSPSLEPGAPPRVVLVLSAT